MERTGVSAVPRRSIAGTLPTAYRFSSTVASTAPPSTCSASSAVTMPVPASMAACTSASPMGSSNPQSDAGGHRRAPRPAPVLGGDRSP